MRQIVNPNRLVPETDYLNNEASCEIEYSKENSFVRVYTCQRSGTYTCVCVCVCVCVMNVYAA